ncbi:MAG: hypothetical protein IPJ65_39725 [Archangiaceae bacterium]|nr:hypothetical protein [Archangiaceae bacterium]
MGVGVVDDERLVAVDVLPRLEHGARLPLSHLVERHDDRVEVRVLPPNVFFEAERTEVLSQADEDHASREPERQAVGRPGVRRLAEHLDHRLPGTR